MLNTVEGFVTEFQSGNESVFSDIYCQLENTRRDCIRMLRRKIPASICMADIEAMFDDALLEAATTFKDDQDCAFVSFLKYILEVKRKMLLRYINADKRKDALSAESLDKEFEPDSGSCLLDLLIDEDAVNAEDNVTCNDLIDLLQSFRDSSKKNKEYADLIAYDCMAFSSKQEKHNAIQGMLGVSLTSSAIHKKIKRAKNAFKEYTEINHYVF